MYKYKSEVEESFQNAATLLRLHLQFQEKRECPEFSRAIAVPMLNGLVVSMSISRYASLLLRIWRDSLAFDDLKSHSIRNYLILGQMDILIKSQVKKISRMGLWIKYLSRNGLTKGTARLLV